MIELRDGEHDVYVPIIPYFIQGEEIPQFLSSKRKKKKEKTILKIDRPIINKILHFDITLSRSIMKLINYIYISLIKQILNFTLYKRSLQKYYRKKIQLSKKLN